MTTLLSALNALAQLLEAQRLRRPNTFPALLHKGVNRWTRRSTEYLVAYFSTYGSEARWDLVADYGEYGEVVLATGLTRRTAEEACELLATATFSSWDADDNDGQLIYYRS